MSAAKSLLDTFLATSPPRAAGCAICNLFGITKETRDFINASKGKGRGSVAVMQFLQKENLWPTVWKSESSIVRHWRNCCK